MGITFGVQGGPWTNPVALREHARMIEDLGYRDLFTADHIGSPDPFLPLAVAAEATTTLRLGTLVLNNEFHNPVLLARKAATFDQLCEGRLTLGLGTGYAQSEHDASGIQLRPPGRRVTRLIESVRVLRSLFDSGTATLDGDEVTVDLADLGVRPVQEPLPFLIGGHGRRMVAAAAAHADIFQFTGLTHDRSTGAPSAGGFDPAQVQQRAKWLDDAATNPERSTLVQQSVVSNSTTEVTEVLQGITERTGVQREDLDELPFILAGDVGQIVEKIHALNEQFGITHFVIREPEAMAPVVAQFQD